MRETHLVALSQCYADHRRLSLSRVGFLAANDGKFFVRLKAGKTCTLRTTERVLQWFSDHWPEDLDWPTDTPRPRPSSDLGSEEAA